MIACKLVHDTGTMIRFRTSQLGELPAASQDVNVLLPTGRVVEGYFNREPRNPNISGVGVVRYIKARLTFGGREDGLVERRTANLWVVHRLQDAIAVAGEARVPGERIRRGALESQDLGALVRLADRESDRGRRVQTYQRVLRPPSLRRLMIGIVGARCMVDGCDVCDGFDHEWGAGSGEIVVDVHHIEQIARATDHHPNNLCVLCANHHRFVHGSGSWTVHHVEPDIVLTRAAREMVIVRPAALFRVA